ncbi:hypothetical protein [Polaromonas eurypsychrophila]|nr:hypothetical protein [Polaromonas eurypsychrophila]
MAENDSKHVAQVKAADHLFTEIAYSAHQIDRLFYHSVSEAADDADEKLNTLLNTVRELVTRMGWMADLGSKKLTGCENIKGDAEQWLMSPAYVNELEASESIS